MSPPWAPPPEGGGGGGGGGPSFSNFGKGGGGGGGGGGGPPAAGAGVEVVPDWTCFNASRASIPSALFHVKPVAKNSFTYAAKERKTL